MVDQDTLGKFELYTIPITGGTIVKINDAMVAGGDIQKYYFSPNAIDGNIIYMGDVSLDGMSDVFRRKYDGSAANLVLSGTYINGATAYDMVVDKNGYSVFTATKIGSFSLFQSDIK